MHADQPNPHSLALILGLALVVSAACHRGRHVRVTVGPIAAFGESEPNDLHVQANDFGFLRPGDHFLIEGRVEDNARDPFDEFLFTAVRPIHVEFRLFIDSPSANLDICLYDPERDEFVGEFWTANNPETGGVDVDRGDVDFHLIVSSFHGSSTYGLEIEVFELFASATAGASAESDSPAVRALSARPLAKNGELAHAHPGHLPAPAAAPMDDVRITRRVQVIALDPREQRSTPSTFILTSDGTWIGTPAGTQ